jgi:hypothetical protein
MSELLMSVIKIKGIEQRRRGYVFLRGEAMCFYGGSCVFLC